MSERPDRAATGRCLALHSYSRVSRVSTLAQDFEARFVRQRLCGSDNALGWTGWLRTDVRGRQTAVGNRVDALPQTTLLRDAKLKRSKSGFRGASRWLHLSLSLRDVAMSGGVTSSGEMRLGVYEEI